MGRPRAELPTEQIVRRYRCGDSSERLAAKFGVSHSTILARLREAGARIRKPGCCKSGLSATSIAPDFNTTILDPEFDEWAL